MTLPTIAFHGEAREAFAEIVTDRLAGYCVTLYRGEEFPVDVQVYGAGDAPFTIRARRWDEDLGEGTGPVLEWIADRIEVH